MFVFCAARLSRLAAGISLAPVLVATTFDSTREMLLLNDFATLESTQDLQTVSL